MRDDQRNRIDRVFAGMIRIYSLTYESVNIMHALFDKTTATQGWRISSRILREYVEFFGPRTEQLDLLAQDSKAIFTSFTEKIQDGKGMQQQCDLMKFDSNQTCRGPEATTRDRDRYPHK